MLAICTWPARPCWNSWALPETLEQCRRQMSTWPGRGQCEPTTRWSRGPPHRGGRAHSRGWNYSAGQAFCWSRDWPLPAAGHGKAVFIPVSGPGGSGVHKNTLTSSSLAPSKKWDQHLSRRWLWTGLGPVNRPGNKFHTFANWQFWRRGLVVRRWGRGGLWHQGPPSVHPNHWQTGRGCHGRTAGVRPRQIPRVTHDWLLFLAAVRRGSSHPLTPCPLTPPLPILLSPAWPPGQLSGSCHARPAGHITNPLTPLVEGVHAMLVVTTHTWHPASTRPVVIIEGRSNTANYSPPSDGY